MSKKNKIGLIYYFPILISILIIVLVLIDGSGNNINSNKKGTSDITIILGEKNALKKA